MAQGKQYYIYIRSNHSRTLYIGVTNDLVRRVSEHKQKVMQSFTKRYNVTMLVYYEVTKRLQIVLRQLSHEKSNSKVGYGQRSWT